MHRAFNTAANYTPATKNSIVRTGVQEDAGRKMPLNNTACYFYQEDLGAMNPAIMPSLQAQGP